MAGKPVLFSPQIIARAKSVSGATAGAEATAFLARTTGLDATHTSAYTALINGLVADGMWSKLDFLHIYATQDSTTAVLNLISTNYNGTVNGSPTFTADRGYTGTNNSTTIYIDSNFNPRTASTPQYALNSAHLSIWGATDTGTSAQNPIGGFDGANTCACIPKFTDNNSYFAANAVSYLTVASASPQGHFISNRSDSTHEQGYKNGSSIATGVINASANVPNLNLSVLANNNAGTRNGSNLQAAMASAGSSLSSGDATAFYNRLRTYMTAVGVA